MDGAGELTPVDLDGVATSPPAAEVVEAMLPWLEERHAHPDSQHARGACARAAIERAREQVAAFVEARPEQVVFTSGATEANNLALKGSAPQLRARGAASIAIGAHEHASLLHPARTLAREGFRLELVPVGRDGALGTSALPQDAFGLLALSHAHPELGTLQPVPDLVAAARRRGALVLVDATLSAGRIPLPPGGERGPDLLTISFHHMGGPMGVGALVVRGDLELAPLIEGGTGERGLRPGSPALPGIVGAGMAARLAALELGERARRLAACARILMEGLSTLEGVRASGDAPERRLAGHVSLTVEGIDGEALVLALDGAGVLAGTGSPCAGEAGLPSASLRAAGYTEAEARGSLVLCVPPARVPAAGEIRRALGVLAAQIARLRSIAPGAA